MATPPPTRRRFTIAGRTVATGQQADIRLKVSETYLGDDVSIHLRVIRAKRPGPTIFVTAAIHGDELNGVGVIHDLLFNDSLQLARGSLILVPVVNVFGFEANERYLPDRRDLNRSFPGNPKGSLAARVAHAFFENVVRRCDYGIDLHTAAIQRTNYPNIRAKLSDPRIRRIAEAFGAELLISGAGPEGSFRREACAAGCPTICVEAGEPWKIEPAIVQFGVRGVRNVLIELGMLKGTATRPTYQTRVNRTTWVRAMVGGILRFHVAPGQIVRAGQEIASNSSLMGEEQNVLVSPIDGIILGMTTLPAVKPGEPVCHIGRPTLAIKKIEQALGAENGAQNVLRRAERHLATSIRQVPVPSS